jgi:hypothetical protein
MNEARSGGNYIRSNSVIHTLLLLRSLNQESGLQLTRHFDRKVEKGQNVEGEKSWKPTASEI